eukprot:10408789-Alexandrium_andersonii.AAC.1
MAGSSHEDPWRRRETAPKVSLRPRQDQDRDSQKPAVRPPGIRSGGQHDQWQRGAAGRDWQGPEAAPPGWHDPEDRTHYRKSSAYQNMGGT